MITRTSRQTVTFRHPFRLSGVDDLQSAGSYVVENDEELLQSLSFPVYRRLATFIRLAGRPNSNELARIVDIDPEELTSALAADAQAHDTAPESAALATGGEIRSLTASPDPGFSNPKGR